MFDNNGPPARKVRLHISVIDGAGCVEDESEAVMVACASPKYLCQQSKNRQENRWQGDLLPVST